MTTNYSPIAQLSLQDVGDNVNTWGTIINLMLQLIEQLVAGQATIALSGGQTTTLSYTNGNTDQRRNMVLKLTGALTGPAALVVPSFTKVWIVNNATTGGQTVTIATSGGTALTLAAGAQLLYCDGSNVLPAVSLDTLTAYAALNLNGQRATNGADPINPGDLSTRRYTDQAIANAGLTPTNGAVKIDGADTTAGYLGAKLSTPSQRQRVVNSGGNELLELDMRMSPRGLFLALL